MRKIVLFVAEFWSSSWSYKFALLTVAIFFVLVATCFFWLDYPYHPIRFNVTPIQVLTPEVHPGEQVILLVDYHKSMSLPAEVGTQFMNDVVITVPSTIRNLPTGDCVVKMMDTVVPTCTPPGHYFLRQTLTYRVNPIRTVIVIVDSQMFEVVNDGQGAILYGGHNVK
jgi:hypothetical protein